MNRLIPVLAAAGFALSMAAGYAQTQTEPGGGKPQMSEQQRHEMREKMKGAYEACKNQADKHACMTEQMCAKAQDPAKCQAHAKERQQKHAQRMNEHQAAAEACTGKRDEALRECMRAQRQKMHPHGTKPDMKG